MATVHNKKDLIDTTYVGNKGENNILNVELLSIMKEVHGAWKEKLD